MVNTDVQNWRKPKLSKRVAAIAFVLLFGIVVAAIWWNVSQTPVNPLDHSDKIFFIAKGDGVREVARKLHDQGLTRDQIAFFLLVKKLGIEKNIQAGSYKLSSSLTAQELAQKLTVGTEDVWIIIPEGWRIEQIVDYLKTKNISWENKSAINTFMGTDGKYFPDTYLVPKETTVEKTLNLMKSNFSSKVTFPVTNDQLIIASLVEREAKTDSDRPLIASVIYNRLSLGMSLDIDATVQYAVGYTQKDGWWMKEPTNGDKKFNSPYNTYLNAGLPPTPICNPGIATIKAAVNPAKSDYLYYIHDNTGQSHFGKTLDEHNANVAKYL